MKKRPFMVRSRDDVLTCARHMHSDALAPIFLTSSVTGAYTLHLCFLCQSRHMHCCAESYWVEQRLAHGTA